MFNQFKLKKNSKITKTNKDINHSLLKSNTPLSINKNKKLNLTGLQTQFFSRKKNRCRPYDYFF